VKKGEAGKERDRKGKNLGSGPNRWENHKNRDRVGETFGAPGWGGKKKNRKTKKIIERRTSNRRWDGNHIFFTGDKKKV